jgi:hypothetical protein
MVNEARALKAGGLLRTPESMKMETAPGHVLIKEASVSEAVPTSVLQPIPAAIFALENVGRVPSMDIGGARNEGPLRAQSGPSFAV